MLLVYCVFCLITLVLHHFGQFRFIVIVSGKGMSEYWVYVGQSCHRLKLASTMAIMGTFIVYYC